MVVSAVALVTGAARGIGAATVAALTADTWTVLAFDRASPDPRLPYAMGTRDQLDAVVASSAVTGIAMPVDGGLAL